MYAVVSSDLHISGSCSIEGFALQCTDVGVDLLVKENANYRAHNKLTCNIIYPSMDMLN